MSISSLGYVGFEVSDLNAWQKFATEFLGMMPGEMKDKVQKYRIDQRVWRFAVEEGEADDVAYLGFETPSPESMAETKERLQRRDIPFTLDDGTLAAERGVREVIVLKDPTGLQVEIFRGATDCLQAPFQSPAGVTGFVTGSQGAGHVVLQTDKVDEVRKFYTEALDLKISDTITVALGPDFTLLLEFYHCNARHHTLALAPVGGPKRMHHFMLETTSFDDVGFALDRVAACNVQQATSLGKHPNDEMISFYTKTPSGFEVEFGCGGVEVDDATWSVRNFDAMSVWGHKQLGG